jgi:hypothetical protein
MPASHKSENCNRFLDDIKMASHIVFGFPRSRFGKGNFTSMGFLINFADANQSSITNSSLVVAR